jgi:hypothetical protein
MPLREAPKWWTDLQKEPAHVTGPSWTGRLNESNDDLDPQASITPHEAGELAIHNPENASDTFRQSKPDLV